MSVLTEIMSELILYAEHPEVVNGGSPIGRGPGPVSPPCRLTAIVLD
jgi:hypothetical protein